MSATGVSNSELSDELIDDISVMLVQDWHKLSIHLGVDIAVTERLYQPKTENFALRMLQMWKATSKNDPRYTDRLVEALGQIHRADLVEFVRESVAKGPDTGISDRTLLEISLKIPNKWFELGMMLQIPYQKLNAIRVQSTPESHSRPEAAMLKAFRKDYNGGNIIEEVRTRLEDIHRRDIVAHFDKRYKERGAGRKVTGVERKVTGAERKVESSIQESHTPSSASEAQLPTISGHSGPEFQHDENVVPSSSSIQESHDSLPNKN